MPTFPYAYPTSTFADHFPVFAEKPTRASGIAIPLLKSSLSVLALYIAPSKRIRPEGLMTNLSLFCACALAAMSKPNARVAIYFILRCFVFLMFVSCVYQLALRVLLATLPALFNFSNSAFALSNCFIKFLLACSRATTALETKRAASTSLWK